MTNIKKSIIIGGVLILCIQFCCGQGNAARPNFPPVFQVEVQGIFKDVKKEMEGSLYYDSINNRVAFHYTYQGFTIRSIYRLDDNELLQISGTECTVSDIRTDSTKTFFPFLEVRQGNKFLAKPDELFFFANSTFEREDSTFPSYVYKAKLKSPLFEGSNCEVTHIFTKPEVKAPACDSAICQPTLTSINVTCLNKEGNMKVNTQYDFFRFKTGIIDTNVFLPPPGVFCDVNNKRAFPGLPAYFSFSYDLTNEKTGHYSGDITVHKKVWYDSKMEILRMDEFDAEGLLLASRVFDIKSGIAYTSLASLSTCEFGIINNKVVPLDEMTKLPKVFFQGKNALSKAVYVGTRRMHELDYEVWSLLSTNARTNSKIVEEFYFIKSVLDPGISEILKLSHAEIYTYQINIGRTKAEVQEPLITYLPVNNFIDRLRWEAFDVSSCFTKEQKKGFRLKVDGPPTMKDSKTFQEVLNQLYEKLIHSTNTSAVRLNELACVFDGVKIVEFTGKILDKPKVLSSSALNFELDMNEAYRMIQYLAKDGKLSLKLNKNGQAVEYKITAIEDIKNDEEDKNLYSGGFVVGIGFGFLAFGYLMGMFAYVEAEKVKKRN